MTLEKGTILNNTYSIISLIGKGSTGNVYLVENIKNKKKLVLKELTFSEKKISNQERAEEIFFREAEIMAKFSHPGLPEMYGMFKENDRMYIEMDYIEGKNLEEIINSSPEPVDTEKAINWIIETTKIMDYLHNAFEKPIVYRDLKPSNIIITPENKVKLVDFGIGRYCNPDTLNCGSPGYTVPEQHREKGRSSPKTDIFRLGVILFHMVTKYDPTIKPFTFPDIQKENPHIPDELKNIIEIAIELKPGCRYISIAEFRETLKKYLWENGPDYVPPEEQGKLPGKWGTIGTYIGIASILFFIPLIMLMIFIEQYYITPIILTLLCLSGIAISLKGMNEAKKDLRISYPHAKGAFSFNLGLLFIVIFMIWCLYPCFVKSKLSGQIIACESHLKDYALALDYYARNNDGLYPHNLEELEEKYIPGELICPKSHEKYGYCCDNSTKNFTLWCPVPNTHTSLKGWPRYGWKEGCWPQYSPGEGIMYK